MEHPLYLVLTEGRAAYTKIAPFYFGRIRQRAFPLRTLDRAYMWVNTEIPIRAGGQREVSQIFLLSRDSGFSALQEDRECTIEIEAWIKRVDDSLLDDSLDTNVLLGLGFLTNNEGVAKEALAMLEVHSF